MKKIEIDDLKTVRELKQERAAKAAKTLPMRKSAQKEFIKDLLARHQDKFEECMNQLAEYDPKAYANLYKDLVKIVVPKQTDVSVKHGLDKDFQELMALGTTKVGNQNAIDVTKSTQILDADFEELDDLAHGTGY